MKVRLVILVMVAGGLAVYFAAGKNKEPVVIIEDEPEVDVPVPKEVVTNRRTLSERPLPGREPADPPEAPDDFAVTVEVDRSKGKNRLYFNITEKHGYYVETFRLLAWYKKQGVTAPEDSPLVVPVYLNEYLKANDTLRTCIEVVPAELASVGGDIGATANWEARIDHYDRSREKNPDPLPSLLKVNTCE